MVEQRRWLTQQIADFQTGGGFKTATRRFLQTAPVAVPLSAGVGFVGGEIIPGLPDLLSAPSADTVLISQEYGPEWALAAASFGVIASAAEAASYPFRIGRMIREGELDEVPAIHHIGNWVVEGVRRSIDHVRHFRRDFHEGGGWMEWRLNIPIFGTAGVIGGASAGVLADMLKTAPNYQLPELAAAGLIGAGVGWGMGALLSSEIAAYPSRQRRREEVDRIPSIELINSRRELLPEEDQELPPQED